MRNMIENAKSRIFGSPDSANFSLVFALTTAGFEFGRIAKDSLFISSVGADAIQYMYVLDGILMVVAATVLSKRTRHISQRTLTIAIYLLITVVVVLLWFLLMLYGDNKFVPYIIFTTCDILFLLLLLSFWGLAGQFFSASEGRKAFPIVGSCGLLGTCLGALSANQLIWLVGSKFLFICWVLTLILCIFILRKVVAQKPQNILQKDSQINSKIDPNNDSKNSPKINPKKKDNIWQVPLIRTLTYMSVPLWLIIYIIEYYYFSTMEQVFHDQDELAIFLSTVVFFASLTGFLIQVFITPRLLRSQGVGATNLVYHFSLTLGAISLLVYSLIPVIEGQPIELIGIALFVLLSRLCDVTVFYSIYDSSSQLLFYSFTDELMRRGQVFISGIVVPASTVLAGIVLISFDYFQMPIYEATFMAVMLGFMLLIISLNVTPEYLSSLIKNMDADDKYKQQEAVDELRRLEISDARYVLLQSISSDNESEALFALEKLWSTYNDDTSADSGGFIGSELLEDFQQILPQMLPSVLLILLRNLGNHQNEIQLRSDITVLLSSAGGNK